MVGLGALVMALVISIHFINFERFKQPLTHMVQQQTGLKLEIKGPVYIRLLPYVGLKMVNSGVWSEATQGASAWYARADALTAQTGLWGLLQGRKDIKAVTIQNGRLEVKDAQGRTAHVIDNIQASGSMTSAQGPFRIEGSLGYEDYSVQVEGSISSFGTFPINVEGTLRPSMKDHTFGDIAVKASLTTPTTMACALKSDAFKVPYVFTLPGKRFDLRKGVKLEGEAAADLSAPAKPVVTLKKLDLGLDSLSFIAQGKLANEHLEVDGDLAEGANRAQLSLKGHIQGDHFKGDISLHSPKPAFILTWAGLENYDVGDIKGLTLTMAASPSRVDVSKVVIHETNTNTVVPLNINYDSQHVRAELKNTSLWGGNAAGKGSYDLNNKAFATQFTIRNVNVIQTPFLKGKPLKKGRIALEGNLKGRVVEGFTANTLNGQTKANLTNVDVEGIDLKKLSEGLRNIQNVTALPSTLKILNEKGTTHIKSLQATVDWAASVGSVKELKGEADVATLKGEGTIDIPKWQINMVTQTQLTNTRLPAIPLVIEGPLDAPHYRVDENTLSQIVMRSLMNRGMEAVGKQLKGSLGSALGGLIGGADKGNGNGQKEEKKPIPENLNPGKIIKNLLG